MKEREILEIRQCYLCKNWVQEKDIEIVIIGEDFIGLDTGKPVYSSIKKFACKSCRTKLKK